MNTREPFVYTKLKPAEAKAYVVTPDACPFCHGEHLNQGNHTIDESAGEASQDVSCRDCGRAWFDKLTFTDVVEADMYCVLCGSAFKHGDQVRKVAGGLVHAEHTKVVEFKL
jgi:hypothetical protein